MTPQLHIARTLRPLASSSMEPLANYQEPWKNKPGQGGLWTSTYCPDCASSDWVRYASRQCAWPQDNPHYPYHPSRRWYLLIPSASARIYEINDEMDLSYLIDHFRAKRQTETKPDGIDWPALAQSGTIDAVHLTRQGFYATRTSDPHTTNWWDCESTIWLHWVFEDMQSLVTPPDPFANERN